MIFPLADYEQDRTHTDYLTRIAELETALQHIAITLIGARNSADLPRDCVSPMVIKIQIDQALRMIKTVL